jgi:glycosyltransferase involved in cell wall biosynthesis
MLPDTMDAHDSAALVREVEAVLNDERLRLERIRRGHEQAAEFTWARTAAEIVRLLDGLGNRA